MAKSADYYHLLELISYLSEEERAKVYSIRDEVVAIIKNHAEYGLGVSLALLELQDAD